MENGVRNPDDGKLEEMKGVQGDDLEQKVEEKVEVGLHGSKESEGDEEFEEAVGAVITEIDSQGRVVILENNGGEVGDLGSSVEINQNLDKGDELEMFEEASSGEGLEETSEVLASEESNRASSEINVDREEKAELLVTEEPPIAPSEITNGDKESGEEAEVLVTEESLVTPCEILNQNDVSGERAELLATEELPVEIPNGGKESREKAELLVTEEFPVEIPNGDKESREKAELLVTEESSVSSSEIPNVDTESGEKEELLVTPSEIPNGVRESGEEEKLLVTEESTIVEQAAPEEVSSNVSEELKHHGIVENGEDELKHAAKMNATTETPNSKDEDEVNEMSSGVPKTPVNGVVHPVNVNMIQEDIDIDKQGKQLHGLPETQDANEVKGGHTDSGQEVESNGHAVDQDVMNTEVNDIYGTPDTGHQEDMSKEHENDEHKGDVINANDEQSLEKTSELKENKTRSLQPENQGNQDKDVPAISTTTTNGHQESSALKDNTYSSVEEKTEKTEGETSSITLEDKKLKAPRLEELPPLEDALAKEAGKISLSSSDSVPESSGGLQPQLPNANAKVSEVVVNQPEKKVEKDEEAKQSIPTIREQQVKPAVSYSSSPVQSAPTPAPLPARPAGLGRTASLLEPAPRVVQQPRVNGAVSTAQNQIVEEPPNGETEENDETREKLQMIRVKFLRLAHRLGQTPHNVVVAQVLYRLGLAEQLRGRNGGRVAAFSFDRASAMAEQLEAAGQEPLDFSCTIMVLGKTGVGKSATINSIFDEARLGTDAFQCGTKKVQDVVGTVQGIRVRVIDTPGLLPSWSDQRQNERILQSVKRYIKKTPPDIVLYLDRLDMQSRDLGDMPLLRTITEVFGPSIWFNAIVVLTHAASAPPEGPNGTATSYDMFVTQRSHAVQQAIRQAAGDMRLMNPVSLVENHSACRTNRAGQRVLPNGQVWKPHLLLLSFASKILAEANALLKLQDSPPGRPFANRTRAPPLPFLLSSLLQSRPQVKLPTDQFGDDDDTLDDDMDDSSDSEDESEYDQLPPFRSLTKAQLSKLPKDQRKAYYAELEYREKLFMKKQLKEEKKRRKMFKKMQAMAKDLPADYTESAEEEGGATASVPVPMPDLALPASFDSDNPTHRYRCLDSSNQWLVRPVLEPNGWDHDVGYEGINVERLFVVKEKVPVSFSGQVSKDKKDTNLQMEVASSMKHGEGKATSVGFDMQSVGKDIAYTVRGETKFMNYRRNKATTGVSVTILGDTVTGGVKVEDKLIVNKRGQVVVSGGAMFGRGDVAYGGSLEATLRDKDHPLGRFLSTLGVSVMDWHGDLAIGCNSQTQIPVGRHTNLIGRLNLNNKGSGQVSIRLNSSEQLQIALIALIPFVRKLLGSLDNHDK